MTECEGVAEKQSKILTETAGRVLLLQKTRVKRKGKGTKINKIRDYTEPSTTPRQTKQWMIQLYLVVQKNKTGRRTISEKNRGAKPPTLNP